MSWLEDEVRITVFRRGVVCAVLMAAVAAFAGWTIAVNTPRILRTTELLSIANGAPPPQHPVRIRVDTPADTWLERARVRKSTPLWRQTTHTIFAAQVAGRTLLISSRNRTLDSDILTGTLTAIPADLNREWVKIKERIRASDRPIKDYPVVLMMSNYFDDGTIPRIGSGLALLVLAMVFTGAVRMFISPHRHTALKSLVADGGTTLASASRSIEADMAAGKTLDVGGSRITTEYAIERGLFAFSIHPLAGLLWAYQSVARTNADQTDAQTMVNLNFPLYGLKLPAKPDDAHRTLDHVETYAPWAAYGYTPQLLAEYGFHRERLMAAVAARRTQAATGAQSTS